MDLAVREVQTLTQATGAVIEIADGDEMVNQRGYRNRFARQPFFSSSSPNYFSLSH